MKVIVTPHPEGESASKLKSFKWTHFQKAAQGKRSKITEPIGNRKQSSKGRSSCCPAISFQWSGTSREDNLVAHHTRPSLCILVSAGCLSLSLSLSPVARMMHQVNAEAEHGCQCKCLQCMERRYRWVPCASSPPRLAAFLLVAFICFDF
jgi:hypothetical protein